MRTYSLFVGEVVSDSITLALPPALRNILETECRAAWKELNKIPSSSNSASPFIPYNEFIQTTEGRVHIQLLERAFYVKNTIPGWPRLPFAKPLEISEYNQAMSRLQARRHNTQGRSRRTISRASNAVEYRKFRSWWVSKHIAEALGAEYTVPPCPFDAYKPAGPTESYIKIGEHFEEWTGLKLPKELWVELHKDETRRLKSLEPTELKVA